MAVQTTEDNSFEQKNLDVAKQYEAWGSGKATINEIADEHNMPAQKVVEAFDAHVQSNKGKKSK